MSEAGDNTVVHVEEAPNRRLEVVADMKVAELKDELKQRRLKTSGNKKELQQRLRAAIRLEIEHGAESDSEEAEDTDDDSDDSEDRVRGVRDRMHALTFMDVQESMNTFSGDDKINIKNWIREFEETATTCKWVDMQKIIYAKRLLRGSAKLFINYEQCCQSWSKMKKALTREFSRVVDAHKIHRDLARRNKRTNETHHEYIYEMFEIGKQIDMDNSSVIKYIIAGIQDDERNKAVLYGAKNIHELKDKFELYEAMKENLRHSNKRFDEKPRRIYHAGPAEEVVRRCFLCGGKDHMSSSCPTKAQGMKCFECREFGHIAMNCPRKLSSEMKESCSVSQSSSGKYYKDVMIRGHRVAALIDTGSDLCLMRTDKYIKIGAPKLQRKEVRFRGVGLNINRTLGQFSTSVAIDKSLYSIDIHVVSDSLLQHEMVVGVDFLNNIDLTIREGNISISKPEKSVKEINSVATSFPANHEYRVNIVDLLHVKADHRVAVENTIGVQKNSALKGDEPIYQRTKQLSLSEREVVDVQVGERQREGIVLPSILECVRTIVKETDNSVKFSVDHQEHSKIVNKQCTKRDYFLNHRMLASDSNCRESDVELLQNACEVVVDDAKIVNEMDVLQNACENVVNDVVIANVKRARKNVKCFRDVKVFEVNCRKGKVREVNRSLSLMKLEKKNMSERRQKTKALQWFRKSVMMQRQFQKGKPRKSRLKVFNKPRKQD